MPAIASILPASGSPAGRQLVTITGTWTATSGTVTVNGRTAEIVTFAPGSVTIRTPSHRTNSGFVIPGGGPVSVVVSPLAEATYAGQYTYKATLAERSIAAVAARIGQISTTNGDFYDITPDQVGTSKGDLDSRVCDGPLVLVAQLDTDYAGGQDTTFGHFVGRINATAQAAMSVNGKDDYSTELNWLAADLFRAIMLSRNDSGGLFHDVRVDRIETAMAGGSETGETGIAVVDFSFELSHIHNDMTTNTEWTP